MSAAITMERTALRVRTRQPHALTVGQNSVRYRENSPRKSERSSLNMPQAYHKTLCAKPRLYVQEGLCVQRPPSCAVGSHIGASVTRYEVYIGLQLHATV